MREWRENRTLSFARQLVGAAIVHKRHDEAREAANLILVSDGVTGPARRLAEIVVGRSQTSTPTNRLNVFIRNARRKTRALPRNPFPWVDLALGYTILGKQREARRALLIAIRIAPNNRFVLRAAVRFFVHEEESDMAHDILLRCDLTKSDPWLLASEVAVASLSERRPKLIRTARRLISQQAHHEDHLNELVGALGTVEFESGSDRIARQLFKRALRNPNENVVAQARWAVQQGLTIEMPSYTIELPKAFEVRAWNDLYLKKWESSVQNSKEWLNYQQFASSPALLGSYVSAVALEDHSTAIEIINDGLRANPSNPMLLNNLAYSLASQGKYRQAERALKSIRASSDESIQVYKTATKGLLHFRRDAVSLGRNYYTESAHKARQVGDRELLKRLLIFWALEEVRVGALLSEAIPERAMDMLRSDKDPVLNILAERLRRMSLSKLR